MKIWFASGNLHKKNELAAILKTKGCSFELLMPQDAGIDFNPDESGGSFFENALIKARELYRILEGSRPQLYVSGDPVIADDSGLCVDALDGRPGIFSARYAGKGMEPNNEKLSSSERNVLLLDELGNNVCRAARFVCAMALLFSPDRFFLAQDICEGEIVKSPENAAGCGGFGYDPVLFLPTYRCTVAELPEAEKNKISHRAKAGMAIAKILEIIVENK
ncbi:MAG: non-canonical purine NTP pyrophosphatase [Treponema sp.]|nr:non-canonical purine NTP pyrophosphatase [Treponema sp.]